MGKRSSFTRRKNDQYFTPYKPVLRLLPFLDLGSHFIEPCAGDGRLIRWLERHGHICIQAFDIDPYDLFISKGDALTTELNPCDVILTNPPWTRELLHPMIDRFMRHAPSWLLYDAAWKHTCQATPFMHYCSHIVNVGRVKWIEGTKNAGKDDSCWYKFDINHREGPKYYV